VSDWHTVADYRGPFRYSFGDGPSWAELDPPDWLFDAWPDDAASRGARATPPTMRMRMHHGARAPPTTMREGARADGGASSGNAPSPPPIGAEGAGDSAAGTGGARTGVRVGGVVPSPPPPPPPEQGGGDPLVLALLILATLVAGGNALGPRDGGGAVYSVSSYSYSSTTVVRADDGTGQPQYETTTQSSFSTNVPGLAERGASERAPDLPRDLLFPF
jgi:hypothetical protein